MIKMRQFLKSKKILLGATAILVAAILVIGVFILLKNNQPSNATFTDPIPTSSEIDLKIPSVSSILPEGTKPTIGNQTNDIPLLNVGGDPKKEPLKQTEPGTNQTGEPNGTSPVATPQTNPTSPVQKPPSVGVTIIPDPTQPKDTSPTPENPADQASPTGWIPPPPGVGTGELIWEGAENIKIDISPTVETLQRDVGLLVGNNLLNAGYNSIYPNASPRDLVEDANRNYARTGIITINPISYGLPKVVGYYNIRLPATGTNAVEASNYISEYMKSDTVFNDKIKTVFSIPKDGWLSVYQKDGYFYILFVVVDIGYSSYE